MPIIMPKHQVQQRNILRDVRPASQRFYEYFGQTQVLGSVAFAAAIGFLFSADLARFADLGLIFMLIYNRWLYQRPFSMPLKFPAYANRPDPKNPVPGKGGAGKSEGILFIGNVTDPDEEAQSRELWLTNTDARTHILYLGTTGAGKTEGLKSMVSNALAWGSGFVYVDGKADTDLWASLYSLARRFGRDDDLLVLNYMTANSDEGATSNTMNPFSNGSASYLSNMIVSLMPDAGGDNAMWKERAVALMFALMPALTWKRDKQGLLLDIGVLREYIELPAIIRLSRDPNLPERIIRGLQGYLNTLPGYVDAAFDDEGNERPPSPDQPMYDLQVARQQHGYLSMQFTRSLQSLADEYGYIFKVQLADIDVLDVVLNRRILVALIPALEKSGDEAANLGKIIAASLKGMMGATLGNTVEGSWENAIGSKQTRSSSSFMTVFDEVGYYTAQGMAVMAAQARSLGFSLVFAAQDIPSMEKRVKQEAQSILGNCNLKIYGKLEDPTDTKKFVEDHGGMTFVMESTGMTAPTSTVSSMFMNLPLYDKREASGVQLRSRVCYDHLRGQREGEAHILFGDAAYKARMFHAVPERVKALRVHRMLAVPASTTATAARERAINEIASRLKDPEWTAAAAAPAATTPAEIAALARNWSAAEKAGHAPLEAGAIAIAGLGMEAGKTAAAKETEIPLPKKAAPGTRAAAESGRKQPLAEPLASIPSVSSGIPAALPGNGQPSLREGDEFAFMELETADEPSVAEGGPTGEIGYVPADLDISVVTRPDGKPVDIDVMSVELPDDLAALMKQSAGKLNQGLGGGASAGDAE
ncbi:MAG: type IV secretion system DNA-binding domain-containing protein [Alphaproteobacteria bacterium]|nr:type IV secretion system DNA-binding domain-containing protein [Alphaproteobacteria bacterium]